MSKKQEVELSPDSPNSRGLSNEKSFSGLIPRPASSTELFPPTSNWTESAQAVVKQAFSSYHKASTGILAIAPVSLTGTVFGSIFNSSALLSVSALGFVAACSSSLFVFIFSERKETQVEQQVLVSNVDAFSSWVKERYSFGVRYELENFNDLVNAVTYGVVEPIPFTGTDDGQYVVKSSADGTLFVEPVYAHEFSLFTEMLADKSGAFNPEVHKSLTVVSSHVEILKRQVLTSEQQHAVERAIEDVVHAVKNYAEMKSLEAPVAGDYVGTLEILSQCSEELNAIKQDNIHRLRSQISSVTSYRNPELDF